MPEPAPIPRLTALLAAAALLCLGAACSRDDSSGQAPVPRPKAYARAYDYGHSYRALDSLPLHIEANAAATVRRPRPGAVDIVYPRYNATIHLSLVTLPADDPEAISRARHSRLERAALNLGATRASDSQHTNPAGFSVITLRALSAIPTPLQLIADDGRRHLLSATAFVGFTPSPSATDSLAPLIDALQGDMRHLADKLTAQ